MKEKDIPYLIERCKDNDPQAQKQLFLLMYNYGMSIASRYAQNLPETEEIANDGFYKMLKNIHRYKPSIPFKLWLRRIIINCAIDHYRKQEVRKVEMPQAAPNKVFNTASDRLDSEYLLGLIRQLPNQYRMVFVLHVIEGYSHEEIGEKLGISKGTSKSNLAKARKKLQSMVVMFNQKSAGYGK